MSEPTTTPTTSNTNQYIAINNVPEDTLLNVRWGTPPQVSYGIAKYAHNRWWDYTSANPHARGRICAAPTGWCGTYK